MCRTVVSDDMRVDPRFDGGGAVGPLGSKVSESATNCFSFISYSTCYPG